MVLSEIKALSVKLDEMKRTISRVIERSEASYVGDLLSADKRIGEIENDLLGCNIFTPSMATRLALIEDRVNPIFERFQFLYQNRAITSGTKMDDLHFKQYDSYLTIEASVLDLRIDILRLKLATQENIGSSVNARERLLQKVSAYGQLWKAISRDPKQVEIAASELENAAKSLSAWDRTMPSWLLGKRGEVKTAEQTSRSMKTLVKTQELSLSDKLADAQSIAESVTQQLTPKLETEANLIYWRDELGEHSFYTKDIQIAGVV